MKPTIIFLVCTMFGCVIDPTPTSVTDGTLGAGAADLVVADDAPDPEFTCKTKSGFACTASCLTSYERIDDNGKLGTCKLDFVATAGANDPARQCYYEPDASIACYYTCDNQAQPERLLVGCAVDDTSF